MRLTHVSTDAASFHHHPSHTNPHLLQDRQYHSTAWEVEQRVTGHPAQDYYPARSLAPAQSQRDPYQATSPTVVNSTQANLTPLGQEEQRPQVIPRHPSQPFGPYTSTVLHRPSESPSIVPGGRDVNYSRIQTHHSTSQPLSNRTPTHGIESTTRTAGTSQFVVPSSRLIRTEPTIQTSPPSQYASGRASHSPEDTTETKPKRRRANGVQLRVLNETYTRTMFPTTEERAEIARQINMTPRQVQIW